MSEHDGNPLVVELQTLRTEALARLDHIADFTALDSWRIDYLGRRGTLTQVMRGIGTLSPEQRPQVGQVSMRSRRPWKRGLRRVWPRSSRPSSPACWRSSVSM